MVDAFLDIPVGGRATIVVGVFFLTWCFLGRPILKLISLALWILQRLLVGIYLLIEFPISILHRKFGSVFAEIDQGFASGTNHAYSFMDKCFSKMNKPNTLFIGRAFLAYLIIGAYFLIPTAVDLTDKPFIFWQEAYMKEESALVKWMEKNGWIADAITVNSMNSPITDDTLFPTEEIDAEIEPTFEPLKYADNGERVVELQEKLNELGYYTDSIDGDFGGNTEVAVKNFQEDMQLEVSGICNEATWVSLFKDANP
jgi:hypothetical protein